MSAAVWGDQLLVASGPAKSALYPGGIVSIYPNLFPFNWLPAFLGIGAVFCHSSNLSTAAFVRSAKVKKSRK